MMDCNEAATLIDDLVDDALGDSEHAALHAHAAGCSACRADIAKAFELKARLAALPDRVAPPRDLWPAIEAKLTGGRARRRDWPRFAAVAAGAAGAAGVMLAALVAIQHGGPAPEPVATATYGGAVVVPVGEGIQLASQPLLDAAERTLSPEAMETVRANLELIDRALREIATALEMDPDNPHLQRQLLDTYRGQADLLGYIGRADAQSATLRTDL